MRTDSRELLAIGIFGRASLSNRIESLLKRGREFSPRASRARIAASVAMLVLSAAASALTPRWIAFAQQPDRPSFDVASIKPGNPGDGQDHIFFEPGGRFSAANATLQSLIGTAWEVRNHQISGGPNWLDSAKFNVEAKAATEVPVHQMRLMIQSLLAERFKLSMHHETREEQLYELVVDRSGSRLKQATETLKGSRQGIGTGKDQIVGIAAQTSLLARMLSERLGRSVIDKTGLAGQYDFTLRWPPDPGGEGGPPDGPDARTSPDPGPSIFTSLQEDLGLKLQSARGPVDILTIDHAEKPDAN
jgi:uncharacterized protein (TIGR03435 family)